jgi:hypothetical protein
MYYILGALLGVRAKTLSARGRPIPNLPRTVPLTPSQNADFLAFIFGTRLHKIEDALARAIVVSLRVSIVMIFFSFSMVAYLLFEKPDAL